jgi:hypothetical protein
LKEKLKSTKKEGDPLASTVKTQNVALREKKEHWLNLLDLEHADALVSDCFWYIICKICNP